jgi:hypothetical protein
VSGGTAIVGRTIPKEVAVALDESEIDVIRELEIDLELTCRSFKVAEEGAEKTDEVDGVLGVELRVVVVDDGSALGIEIGIATGQKDHTLLPSSQYKSISNLRKPTASKFDKQSPESSSSYLRCGKQAAVNETPGPVTKLIGILKPSSLKDLETSISTGRHSVEAE